MASKAGTGFSVELGAFTAGATASRAALAEVGAQPDFCLVFGTSGYDSRELLRGVREVFPEATLAGCMGEGVIAGDFADERDRAVSVLAVKSSSLRFAVTTSRRYGTDPEGAASDLVEWLSSRDTSDALGCCSSQTGSRATARDSSAGCMRASLHISRRSEVRPVTRWSSKGRSRSTGRRPSRVP